MQPRRYYSQGGEDLLLWTVFRDRKSGFFVDVGAFDGVHLSNSFSFEEQGWSGICIEAHPVFAPICLQRRPASTCVEAACVGPGQSGRVTMLVEPLGLLSGIRADETVGMDKRYLARGMQFSGFQSVEVAALTLDEVLLQHPPPPGGIDFISIDVEGTELDVLSGFSGDARIFVIEANSNEEQARLIELMKERRHELARQIGRNFIFARDPVDVATLRAAQTSGTTEVTEHPLGSRATVSTMVGKHVVFEPLTEVQ